MILHNRGHKRRVLSKVVLALEATVLRNMAAMARPSITKGDTGDNSNTDIKAVGMARPDTLVLLDHVPAATARLVDPVALVLEVMVLPEVQAVPDPVALAATARL